MQLILQCSFIIYAFLLSPLLGKAKKDSRSQEISSEGFSVVEDPKDLARGWIDAAAAAHSVGGDLGVFGPLIYSELVCVKVQRD
ncbi:hypothetical protein AAHA92_13600 [Salvia divinorum]|uniref:Uncharacterized protein n=1 Tax=Salvia divinorum TaxID=28513 RepID=A0ABD1H8S4_SALDI